MPKDYRRCISCRKLAHRQEFWRVVKCHPDRQIAIDRGDKILQGRSAYLCQTAECLKIAQKKSRFNKALKAKVDDTIYADLERE